MNIYSQKKTSQNSDQKNGRSQITNNKIKSSNNEDKNASHKHNRQPH